MKINRTFVFEKEKEIDSDLDYTSIYMSIHIK